MVADQFAYKRSLNPFWRRTHTPSFAYRLGIGQLIMQSETGRGLYLLLLDEPTESGQEHGSVYRLADAISRSKAIHQMIAVTRS